jgi:hypothetical protein
VWEHTLIENITAKVFTYGEDMNIWVVRYSNGFKLYGPRHLNSGPFDYWMTWTKLHRQLPFSIDIWFPVRNLNGWTTLAAILSEWLERGLHTMHILAVVRVFVLLLVLYYLRIFFPDFNQTQSLQTMKTLNYGQKCIVCNHPKPFDYRSTNRMVSHSDWAY